MAWKPISNMLNYQKLTDESLNWGLTILQKMAQNNDVRSVGIRKIIFSYLNILCYGSEKRGSIDCENLILICLYCK